MLKRNMKEYSVIREEVNGLKSCVTTYFGYLMAGSGAALIGLASLSKIESDIVIITPIVAILLSLGVSFFLYILLYKFNSHNRAVGYCKLLLHERDSSNLKEDRPNEPISNSNIEDIAAWEFCITRLRETDATIEHVIQQIENNDNLSDTIKENLVRRLNFVSGPTPVSDKEKISKGITLLVSTLFGKKAKTNSWEFPAYVILIFFLITTLFFVFGMGLSLYYTISGTITNYLVISTIVVTGMIVQRYIWRGFFGKFFALMLGSATVDSFCWKFLPSRIEYLADENMHSDYALLDENLGMLGLRYYVDQPELFERKGAKGFILGFLHIIFGDKKLMSFLCIPKNDDRKYIDNDDILQKTIDKLVVNKNVFS